jgi:hypothetical protein
MAVIKRKDSEEAKKFWANVAKASAFFGALPEWKKAKMISLNPTKGAQLSTAPSGAKTSR